MMNVLRSRVCQVAGVALTFFLVAVFHRDTDGLWYGDAAQHAMNGLFWWDLLQTWPSDPMGFTLSYYARYPVINPAKYPPLFYILEGLVFSTFGPSPYAARGLVLVFAIMAGLYTMAWTRRWIGPVAGWAGAFLAFIPGVVVWSNAVMLNIPATALGLASLYHLRRWSDTASMKQLGLTALFLTAVLLTYYPGGIVLSVCGAWLLFRRRGLRFDRRFLWVVPIGLCAILPVVVSVLLGPVHASRHLPSIAFLLSGATWTYYWRALPDLLGGPLLAFGLVGVVAGLANSRWRVEAGYVLIWITILIVSVSLLPARNPRYVLLIAPAVVIAAAVGVACAAEYLRRLHPAWQVGLLAASLSVGLWSAARTHVPDVSGFRDVATYLYERAPTDAVLYEGSHEGLFGFYVRALDPHFDRRLARADKLLYRYGPTTSFDKWTGKSNVQSTDDVVELLRTRAGCRFVAIEVGRRPPSALGPRLLREALARSEFALVRSFPVTGVKDRRVDLYRLVDDVEPVVSVDLSFPSFNNRTFPDVVPITR
jgi:hypothetical protein